MSKTPIRRSRLLRQENRRMAKQTVTIIIITLVLIIFFFTVGIPSLVQLAVNLGNSKANTPLSQQDDTIPPTAPFFNAIPESTSSAQLDLSGSAEALARITLYHNNAENSQTTSDSQGEFSFSQISLDQGTNTFTATATDKAGNTSLISSPLIMFYSNTPPSLNINEPQSGERFSGPLEQLITIKGTTDNDVQVTLNDRILVVTSDGSFSTSHQLDEGNNTLTFTATDKAGNQTQEEIEVNYSR
jgi:bacillopeptidase F